MAGSSCCWFHSSTFSIFPGVGTSGSILSSSLFVLFVNDISTGLSPGTNIVLFADDTAIWREIAQERDFSISQKDIDYLLDWAIRNRMTFFSLKWT